MRSILLFAACTLFAISAKARVAPSTTPNSLSIIENKGQIKDQDGNARGDIQYVLPVRGMNIFIGNGQLHYQFTRVEVTNGNQPGTYIKPELRRNQDEDRYIDPMRANIHTYRLDVELVGANITAPVPGKRQLYYENFYGDGLPLSGLRAYSYDKVTYKNVYPDIDWVIFVNGNKLEHEFVVGSKGDASKIKLRYKGHTSLRLDNEGSLVASTPMGTITEKAPVCYGADGSPKASGYKLNGNELTYDLKGFKEAILIDPELIWGTYYGPDSSTSPFYDIHVYDSASLYACGLTWSGDNGSIATVGSHQATFGGYTDAYLVKFDTGGIRQWATYYGGVQDEYATGVTCDASGKVYMCGLAASPTGIATPGATQTTFGGGSSDGFLAKFGADGSREWGTYIGGNGSNFAWAVSCDLAGFIYVSGDTNEGTGISTPSGHQPTKSGGFDWYVQQYDNAGVRQWGTYYGGPGPEWNGASCSDGYVLYLTGWTTTTTLSTPFAHQVAHGGGTDAMVVKFFSSGAFSWATYYGGSGSETVGGIACDVFKNIYLYGHTNSDNNISTATSFQPSRSGNLDAFLVKFHPEIGYRMWGTYYGGPGNERTDKSRICTDDSANIYIIGITESTSGVASDTAWQTVYGGGDGDGFLGKFNHIGERKWCTYIGGANDDDVRAVSTLGQAVFICGQTSSPDSIATPGAFLASGGSNPFIYQGYLEKFSDPDTASIPEDTTTIPTYTHTNILPEVHLELFPNPNNGTFSLQGTMGDRTGIGMYTVIDVAGRMVLNGKTSVHAGKVDEQVVMGNVPTGVYWLKYRSPEGHERVVTFRKE